jgi:DNA polymerase V
MEQAPPPRQQIMASRSFGRLVTEIESLRQAVSTYTARAAEKLRYQRSQTSAITVFLNTPPFNPSEPQYHPSVTIRLADPTDDPLILCQSAGRGLERMYKPGFRYQKAGVMLLNLEPKGQGQLSLFDTTHSEELVKRDKLLAIMDGLNRDMGRETVWTASQGLTRKEKEDSWRMKRGTLSPSYTTKWKELPQVLAN